MSEKLQVWTDEERREAEEWSRQALAEAEAWAADQRGTMERMAEELNAARKKLIRAEGRGPMKVIAHRSRPERWKDHRIARGPALLVPTDKEAPQMIKGFEELTAAQQEHITKANAAHKLAVWPESRSRYELVEVWIDEQGTTCAKLAGGDWYHYYQDGTWG